MICSAHETGRNAAILHRASGKMFLGHKCRARLHTSIRRTQLQCPVDTCRVRVQRRRQKKAMCYQLTRDDAAVMPCAARPTRLHYTRITRYDRFKSVWGFAMQMTLTTTVSLRLWPNRICHFDSRIWRYTWRVGFEHFVPMMFWYSLTWVTTSP